jgi:leucyl-tRNA synthetase
MRYRDVLKYALYDFTSLREEYLISIGDDPKLYRRDLIIKYIHTQLILLYPICPHMAEVIYTKSLRQFLPEGAPEYISRASFPEVDMSKVDFSIIKARNYINDLFRTVRLAKDKAKKKNKCVIVFAKEYFDWQLKVLDVLNACTITEDNKIFDDWKIKFTGDAALPKNVQTQCLMFGSFVIKQMESQGRDALSKTMAFNELDMLNLNMKSLEREFKMSFELMEVVDAANHKDKLFKNAAGNVKPGQPAPIFTE